MMTIADGDGDDDMMIGGGGDDSPDIKPSLTKAIGRIFVIELKLIGCNFIWFLINLYYYYY